MSEKHYSDQSLYFNDLSVRITESLTDMEWIVLERRVIYGDTLEDIGATLGLASVRVTHIMNRAVKNVLEQFNEDIESFSIKLEKVLVEAGGVLKIRDCLRSFTEMSENEFMILFAFCMKKREGLFHRENEMISIGEKT